MSRKRGVLDKVQLLGGCQNLVGGRDLHLAQVEIQRISKPHDHIAIRKLNAALKHPLHFARNPILPEAVLHRYPGPTQADPGNVLSSRIVAAGLAGSVLQLLINRPPDLHVSADLQAVVDRGSASAR